MRIAAGISVMAMGLAMGWCAPVGAAPTHTPIDRVTIVHTKYGNVIADGRGMTLYVYVDDLLSVQAACTADCLHDWRPALARGRVNVVSGVTGSIGSIDRPGVGRQLTMDERPLYTFSGDRPGEVRGNGVGNLWWAMTPTGLTATSFPVETTTYGAPGLTTLRVVATAVGPAVANDRGQVLYEYGDDTPSTSNCGADWCLVDWPPLEVSGAPTVPSGITAPIAVIGGADGTRQITLGGHPLYTFAGDIHPGDLRGQGVGRNWYLVSPSGQPIVTPTARTR